MSNFRLPSPIEPLLAGYSFLRVDTGMSGAHVFRLTREGDPTLFLKCAMGSGGAELRAEAERLRWLIDRVPVPQVIAFASESLQSCLLTQALPGRSAVEVGPERARAMVIGFASALQRLHAQPIAECPFDQRLATQTERARERTYAGLVDEEDFDAERRGRRADELLEQLEREYPDEEDLVLTRGDACLPNVILEEDRFIGFVDCSRAGIADRYQDLALVTRSITSNWGAEWTPLFFQTYGLPEPSSSKLAFYRLLDEFF